MYNAIKSWINRLIRTRKRMCHEVMLERLRAANGKVENLPPRDLRYWANRFQTKEIGQLTDATFERYLYGPCYWEGIANGRQELHRRIQSNGMLSRQEMPQGAHGCHDVNLYHLMQRN